MIKRILLSLIPMAGCSAATLHVNVASEIPGDGSAERPFRTIQQAADMVSPGDTVVIAPGIYFETVRLTRFGKPGKPVTFRADRIRKNRVVITGADPAIRRGEQKWTLFHAPSRTFCTKLPYRPGRVLYSGTDLFPYQSLKALMSFEARPGLPGPKHGFYQRDGRLFVRLRPDGKYGPADPNRHIMAVSPRIAVQNDELKPDSRAYNFGLFGKAGEDLHVIIDGITFETPARSAIYCSGNKLLVRNCLFAGCHAGGVSGRTVQVENGTLFDSSDDITLEFCEWHSFPIFDDVKERILEFKSGAVSHDPKYKSNQYWVHKSRSYGTTLYYETGIVRSVGKNWTIRNCYIHDVFDGIANLNYGENTVFEENLFERCIDNAVETEDHAKNCHIRRNRIVDVFQGISYQPLGGKPWPGPVYVYQNLFMRTPENSIWGGGGGAFKIGIQPRQWEFPKLKASLAETDKNRIAIPGGLLIFNNTVIDPSTRLFCALGGTIQKLENVLFFNNLVVAANIQHPMEKPGEGGVFFYRYINNRIGWTTGKPHDVPSLHGQVFTPEAVLPGWRRNSFVPTKFDPAVPVPGAPVQFRCIGALQSPDERIAARTGVQEE